MEFLERQIQDLELRSTDQRFGIFVPKAEVYRLVTFCSDAFSRETGGVLLGSYNSDGRLAVVSRLTPPPSDSRFGTSWFVRGTRGLTQLLDSLWNHTGEYYLGEWHFHPEFSPRPSLTDRKQMRSIARSRLYRCPEPLLVIVGGHPPDELLISATVFARRSQSIEETPLEPSGGTAVQ